MRCFLVILLVLAHVSSVHAIRTKSSKGAKVYIIEPKEGDLVKSPFTVRFGLKGMGVAPAGVAKENTGHHHLFIDRSMLKGKDLEFSIPAGEENLLHFGKGQTETDLILKPGTHTLQLLMGDHNHVPHNPVVMSRKIIVTVVR